MFETELILWLQSFASDCLSSFLVLVSEVGERRIYVLLALSVTFGLDFRVGFALCQMVLWNSVLTNLLKDIVALPRPAEVDSRVQLLGRDTINTTPFFAMDGDQFLDLPEAEVIEYYRARPDVAYGLPSGHVSMATTFWLGSAMLLRSRVLGLLAAAFISLMALSRMYLGRHFLADVLSGCFLGVLVVLAVRSLLRSQAARTLLFTCQTSTLRHMRSFWFITITLILIPMALLLLGPRMDVRSVGLLLGTNIAFAVLFLQGPPAASSSLKSRIARVAIVLLLFAASAEAMEGFIRLLNLHEHAWGEFLDGSIPPLVSLLGTVKIGSFLRLYEPRRRSPVLEHACEGSHPL